MPGAVPITSTFALTNAMMPYIMLLAEEGVHATLQARPRLRSRPERRRRGS
jgi:alanine dehydrogenase